MLPDFLFIREAASKKYVDDKYNDPSITKNTTHVDFSDKNLNNVHSIKVNSFPTLEEQLTPKSYVDQAAAESSFKSLDHDEKLKLDERGSILLNSTLTITKTKNEIPNKNYVGKNYIDPSLKKNSAHVEINDKNLDNVKIVKVNSITAVREHLTPKHYVDQAIYYHVHEPSVLRLYPDEKLKLDEQDSKILNSSLTSPKTLIELRTKSCVDSVHEINRNRRDLSTVFND